MVRLKDGFGFESSPNAILFQFQYGSIKRYNIPSISGVINLFQFQYGSIKSELEEDGVLKCIKFQFQYGSIKRVCR